MKIKKFKRMNSLITKGIRILCILLLLGMVNFCTSPSALGNDSISTSPDVWVIDSNYRSPGAILSHGEKVTSLIEEEAPKADVHFEAVSNGRKVSSDKIAQAVKKAANNGAEVINLSLGAPEMSETLADAIDYAKQKGVTVVAAAGNNGRLNYPAAYEGVVSVGSVNPYSGEIAEYSSAFADVNANGSYLGSRGTSFAAPRISGRIARKMYEGGMSASEAEQYVVNKKDDTSVGSSTPELVKRDILLDLFAFAIIDSMIRNSFSKNNMANSGFKKSPQNNWSYQNKKLPGRPFSSNTSPSGFTGRKGLIF